MIAVVLQFTGAPIILAYMALAMWMKGPVHEWTKRKFHQVMAEKMNREKSADFEDVEDPLDHVVHEKDKEWSDF